MHRTNRDEDEFWQEWTRRKTWEADMYETGFIVPINVATRKAVLRLDGERYRMVPAVTYFDETYASVWASKVNFCFKLYTLPGCYFLGEADYNRAMAEMANFPDVRLVEVDCLDLHMYHPYLRGLLKIRSLAPPPRVVPVLLYLSGQTLALCVDNGQGLTLFKNTALLAGMVGQTNDYGCLARGFYANMRDSILDCLDSDESARVRTVVFPPDGWGFTAEQMQAWLATAQVVERLPPAW